jgi:hypothetical protein
LKLQEWSNDGSKWVYVGQWTDLKQDEIEPLVQQWLKPNTKLVLIDDDDEFVKEFV